MLASTLTWSLCSTVWNHFNSPSLTPTEAPDKQCKHRHYGRQRTDTFTKFTILLALTVWYKTTLSYSRRTDLVGDPCYIYVYESFRPTVDRTATWSRDNAQSQMLSAVAYSDLAATLAEEMPAKLVTFRPRPSRWSHPCRRTTRVHESVASWARHRGTRAASRPAWHRADTSAGCTLRCFTAAHSRANAGESHAWCWVLVVKQNSCLQHVTCVIAHSAPWNHDFRYFRNPLNQRINSPYSRRSTYLILHCITVIVQTITVQRWAHIAHCCPPLSV